MSAIQTPMPKKVWIKQIPQSTYFRPQEFKIKLDKVGQMTALPPMLLDKLQAIANEEAEKSKEKGTGWAAETARVLSLIHI